MKTKTLFKFILFLVVVWGAFFYFTKDKPAEVDVPFLSDDNVIKFSRDDGDDSQKVRDDVATSTDETADVIIDDDVHETPPEETLVDEDVPGGPPVPVGDQEFITYTNKTVGYTISRPDQWYWQHLTRAEIGEKNPLVHDYFIADRNPLLPLGSEYLGEIVIEVSKGDIADFADSVSGFSKEDREIGGKSAVRYEGMRGEQKIIEYHFTKGSFTFRIIYARVDSTEEEEKIFETIVTSLTF